MTMGWGKGVSEMGTSMKPASRHGEEVGDEQWDRDRNRDADRIVMSGIIMTTMTPIGTVTLMKELLTSS